MYLCVCVYVCVCVCKVYLCVCVCVCRGVCGEREIRLYIIRLLSSN